MCGFMNLIGTAGIQWLGGCAMSVKPAEIRRLSVPELEERSVALRRQLFILRIQHSQRQLAKPAQIRQARRELARVLTVVAEKHRGGEKQ